MPLHLAAFSQSQLALYKVSARNTSHVIIMHNFIIFCSDSLVLNSNYTVHVLLFLIVLDQMREDRSQSSVDFSLITVQLIHGPNSSRWCRPCNNYYVIDDWSIQQVMFRIIAPLTYCRGFI